LHLRDCFSGQRDVDDPNQGTRVTVGRSSKARSPAFRSRAPARFPRNDGDGRHARDMARMVTIILDPDNSLAASLRREQHNRPSHGGYPDGDERRDRHGYRWSTDSSDKDHSDCAITIAGRPRRNLKQISCHLLPTEWNVTLPPFFRISRVRITFPHRAEQRIATRPFICIKVRLRIWIYPFP